MVSSRHLASCGTCYAAITARIFEAPGAINLLAYASFMMDIPATTPASVEIRSERMTVGCVTNNVTVL